MFSAREHLPPRHRVLIRMEFEDNKRRRRVSESEEAALLAVASPHLPSMIIAALDTGMRRGEMLALRFGDIDWTRRMITSRGATTKSRRTRLVPARGPRGCHTPAALAGLPQMPLAERNT